MKWIKKWSFLCILVVMGVVFLSVTDSWYVMAEPYFQMRDKIKAEGLFGQEGNEEGLPEEEGLSGEGGEFGEEELSGEGDSGEEGLSGEGGLSGGEGNLSGEEGLSGEGGESGEGELSGEGGESVNGETGQTGEGTGSLAYRNPEDVVYVRAEDDYFADALFIGDSRTVGMFEYGGLENISTFYAYTGMTIHKLLESQVAEVLKVQKPPEGQPETEMVSIEEALTRKKFKKIYLMVGINEMGMGTVESFAEKYGMVVERLKELQPDAIIYIQGIMKVTTDRSNQGDYITNAGIEERNAQIAKLADNVRVYYLDVNPLVCDESGGMEPSYTSDGVHLKAMYISIWKEFLKENTVLLD